MNLREEVCAIKTSLTPATFEIPVPARKVTDHDIYIWFFLNCSTVWYSLFCLFHFIICKHSFIKIAMI